MKRFIVAVSLCFALMLPGVAMSQNLAGAVAGSDQQQGQYQGQGQSTSSSGGSVADSGNVRINGSFNGAAPIRYLPIPSAVPMENYQAQIFGRADYGDKGPNFISMRQLIAAMNHVDLGSDVRTKSLTINTQIMSVSKNNKAIKKVLFELNDGEAVNDGFMPVAVVTIAMKKTKKVNSASLAMALGQKAKELKCKRVVFLTEGSSKQMNSGGWGIGLSYNYAKVGSGSNDQGTVGAGGTGYSRGWARNVDLVYLSAIMGN